MKVKLHNLNLQVDDVYLLRPMDQATTALTILHCIIKAIISLQYVITVLITCHIWHIDN